jgi:hypothetical protein
MKTIDPRLMRVIMIVVGVGVGVCTKLWLTGTALHDECMLAAGWLIGQALQGPGQVDVKQLEKLSMMPPSNRPPPSGP